jgi:hypothetical protein
VLLAGESPAIAPSFFADGKKSYLALSGLKFKACAIKPLKIA